MMEAAVFGSRGYLGRTLLALLADHPHVETVHPVSSSVAGRPVGEVLSSMKHKGSTAFVEPGHEAVAGADVAFLATGSSQAKEALATLPEAPDGPDLVVDLSRAHRKQALAGTEATWSYGLPGLEGWVAKGDQYVANPGCYPTAALLGIGPALEAGLVGEGALVVDGKSGVSGAGATPRDDLHFPETNESVRAYGIEDHDHAGEIQAAAAHLDAQATPQAASPVRFVPHLVPQNRGLLATVYAPVAGGVEADDVDQAYQGAYADGGQVQLVAEPDTAPVRGSNQAHVAVTLDEDADLLVARCAIDNLLKGGAGAAVGNMNRALGFEEHAGLPWTGVAP